MGPRPDLSFVHVIGTDRPLIQLHKYLRPQNIEGQLFSFRKPWWMYTQTSAKSQLRVLHKYINVCVYMYANKWKRKFKLSLSTCLLISSSFLSINDWIQHCVYTRQEPTELWPQSLNPVFSLSRPPSSPDWWTLWVWTFSQDEPLWLHFSGKEQM